MKPKGGKRFSTGTQIFLVTLLNINCLLLNSFHFFLWQYECAVEREGGKGHGEREEQNLQCRQRL
jgi:hypothetical protein